MVRSREALTVAAIAPATFALSGCGSNPEPAPTVISTPTIIPKAKDLPPTPTVIPEQERIRIQLTQ